MDWQIIIESTGTWISSHGVQIFFIIIVAAAVYIFVKALLSRGLTRYVDSRQRHAGHPKEERVQRAKTLSGVLVGALGAAVFAIAAFMILAELTIDIAPLIASAGVIGIALGFGAQSVIKDVLNGLFILLEDQFNNGDVIKVANIAGLVEDLNLRRTVLRDLDGIVHIIPNGQILTVSNYTHEWARVNLNVPVAYSTDLDKAIAVINRVGRELFTDPAFSPMIISAPQVLRVDKFADSGIEIKILGDVKPMNQWPVAGELRRRLKQAFDDEGIEIPYPHTKFMFDDAQLSEFARLSRLAEVSVLRQKDRETPPPAPPPAPKPPPHAPGLPPDSNSAAADR